MLVTCLILLCCINILSVDSKVTSLPSSLQFARLAHGFLKLLKSYSYMTFTTEMLQVRFTV